MQWATHQAGQGTRAAQPPLSIDSPTRQYQAERKRLAGDVAGRKIRLTTRSSEIGRELERLVDAIATGAAPASVIGPRIALLEAEKQAADGELAAIANEADVVTIHPAAIARYLGQIEELSATLNAGVDIAAGGAAANFRSLVQSVIVHPVPPKSPLQIEIRGYLAELTRDSSLKPACHLSGYLVVAEEGLATTKHRKLVISKGFL